MSAELLRRAAKTLREHAEMAMPGRWESLDAGDRLVAWLPDGHFEYLVTEEPARHGETADYIALMHPAVAMALADWLERLAEVQRSEVDDRLFAYGVYTARAVLREES